MTVVSIGSVVGSITSGLVPGSVAGFVESQNRYLVGASGAGLNPGTLVEIDEFTGASISVSPVVKSGFNLNGMVFDRAMRLYGILTQSSILPSELALINQYDGRILNNFGEIFSALGDVTAWSLSYDPRADSFIVGAFVDGVNGLYYLSSDGNILSTILIFGTGTDVGEVVFDWLSGEFFFVGKISEVLLIAPIDVVGGIIGVSIVLTNFYSGVCFDRHGKLFGVKGGTDEVYDIDPVSGAEVLVGSIVNAQGASITITPDFNSLFGTVSNELKVSIDGDGTSIILDPTLLDVGFEGTRGVTMYGYRVMLGGVDVSESVVGEITILRDLDRLTSAELSLHGKEFSFVVTESTWTRTLLDIYFSQGPPGGVLENKKFSGYVQKGSSESGNTYRITALDLGLISSKSKVCLELDPESGLSRDTIVRDVLTTAGFSSIDIPTMEIYNKPFNFTDGVWGSVVEFIEPEGYHLKMRVDGTVEAYRIRLRDVPDHRWDVSEMIDSPEITPPDPTASVLIFRGDVVSEQGVTQGVEIELRRTPVLGILNTQTTHEQDGSGNITERNFALGKPHSSFTKLQLIKIVEAEIHRLGNKVILKIEREYGFKNPSSARYKTIIGGGGPGPQGTNYVPCYVTGNDFVVWPSAKFVQTLERREVFLFDVDGTDIGSRVESNEYFKKTHAIQTDAGNPITGVYVGDDNMSYARNGPSLHQIEGYGLRSRFEVDRFYDEDTGAQGDETQRTFGWYSIRRETVNGYLLFDGSAQSDQVAQFQLIESTFEPLIIDSSGRKAGEVEVKNKYFVRESSIGVFDYGAFAAEAETETFRTVGVSVTSFDALNSSFFSKITYANGLRSSEDFPGRPPVPRYKSSSFTRYISEPIEVILDDSLVEAWFGAKSEVVQIRHAITVQELNDILTRRQSRKLSFQVRVVRHETLGRIGDSVLLTDHNQGLFAIGVIVSIRDTRAHSSSLSEYFLEVPLFETGLPL